MYYDTTWKEILVAAIGDIRIWYALKYEVCEALSTVSVQCNSLTTDKNILVCDCEMNSVLIQGDVRSSGLSLWASRHFNRGFFNDVSLLHGGFVCYCCVSRGTARR
jgi:hypothetical protein